MNILETVLSAGGGGALDQLAEQFGLSREQTSKAVSALMPALAAGLQQNMTSQDGVSSLLSALSGGGHQKYLENPGTLAEPSTTNDGNAILGHLLGSKDVSRQVAANASQETGVDTGTLKKMLPLVASLAMGGLARGTATGSEAAANPQAAGGGILSMLGPVLAQNRGGSGIGGAASIIGGLFGSRKP